MSFLRPLERIWNAPPGRPEETRLFVRLAAYGLGIGLIYWFVSYETAGTVLLVGFGLGAAL
ncbi:MAG TPA: hypothetical protein VNJ28_06840, partial [Candidatus Limnocylindrales bacterium]|nr:hypothetical protein [Candidatus Limnocylindrales bacterium]